MIGIAEPQARPFGLLGGELRKLSAFLRRDFLIAWSYRGAFIADWAGLLSGTFMFYFLGKLVDPSKLPQYGGSRTTYMEFAASGIALGVFIQLGLGRVGAALRSEQVQGTLESLLMTPTLVGTIQVGSAVYELVYVPIRTALFFVIIAVAFGLHFKAAGIGPAVVALVLFIPFVWGLGVLSAAMTLTFRRAGGVIGLGVAGLTLGSGAFFPIQLFPHWLKSALRFNPMTLAVDGTRRPLLGGGWGGVWPQALLLAPIALATLAVGIVAFRLAMRREQRRGTLGLY